MTVTIAALVYGLVAWINGTGMIEPAWPDRPLEVNRAGLAGMADDMERCFALKGVPVPSRADLYAIADRLDGFYCLDRITISGRIDLEGPEGQTVLVHELVHWLQDYNGGAEAAKCLAELERDAYAVHHQWQAQMGLPIYPDPFTVYMRSQCPER